MACNVFGNPITDETLKSMPQYHDKKISQQDRAYVAMDMKNAEGKDVNARNYVEDLKKRFPAEQATLCLIYNATGDPVTYVRDYQWQGHLCDAPYPVVILNGQWGAFLHGQWPYVADTKAAVVYSGKNNVGHYKDWLITWQHVTNGINGVYTEIRQPHYYDEDRVFQDYVVSHLSESKSVCKANDNGGLLFGAIGNMATAVLEAIMTLPETIGWDDSQVWSFRCDLACLTC